MAQHLGKGPDAVLEKIFPGHLDIFLSNAIRAGDDSIANIEKALNECNFAIVLATEVNNEEPWLQYELGALTRPTNGEKRIVPILLLGNLRSGQLPSTMNGKQQRYARKKMGFLDVLLSLNEALSDFKTKQGSGSAPSDEHVKAGFSDLWPGIEKLNKKLAKDAAKVAVKNPQHLLLEEIAADIEQLKVNLGTTAFLSGAREKARRADFLKEAATLVGGEQNLGRLDVAGEDLYALNIKVPETDAIARSIQEAFARRYSGDGIGLLIIDPDFFGPADADADAAAAADIESEYV
jgi:hypothetical protein